MEQKVIKELNDQAYHEQVTKLCLYFKLLNEDTRAEFMELVHLMFALSEKFRKLSKAEIQLEVIKRYYTSQDTQDIFYILDFAKHLQKVKSFAFKDKLLELVKGFCK